MPSTRFKITVRLAPEDEHLVVELKRLAGVNNRDVNDEVVHAIRRHLKQPPTVRVVVKEPKLSPAIAETPAKPKRGRPRKPSGQKGEQ